MMDKNKQFKDFITKLKSGDKVSYTFSIGMDWFEDHDHYEDVNNDWIEGVTERLIDGDSGREWFTFEWKYNSTDNEFDCYVETDLDEKERRVNLCGDDELKYFFLDD